MAGKDRFIRIKYVGGPGEVSPRNTQIVEDLQRTIFDTVHEPIANSYWWIALDEGIPVAFCALHHYRNRPDTAFMALCGVAKSHRGLGLQRRLIKVRVRKSIQLGISRIISYTTNDNAPSANNLIAHGFKVYVPRYEWGIKNAIYFRRTLN